MNKVGSLNSNNKSKGFTKWEVFIVAFLIFFLTRPYFFWQWYDDLFVSVLVSTVAMVIIWKHTGKLTARQKSVFSFYVLLWLFYIVNEFSKGARLGVVAYLPYLLFGFVPFMNKDFGKKVFRVFTTLYAILIALSMVSWIAAMLGVISPIGQLGEDIDSLAKEHRTYIVYPLSLIATNDFTNLIRFCGFFDEPGVVGTLAGLILCALRFNMKDWRCIIILVSGLLSTSMFFYGLAAVYWSSELLFVKKKAGTFLALLLGIFVFYEATRSNEVISSLVWDRFEWNSSKGGFVGNTREGEKTKIAMKQIRESGEIWLGVKDKKAYWRDNFGSSSIYNTFAMYGVIFVTMFIVWLLMMGRYYKANKWDYLLFCFVVFGCMYQRSSLFHLPYIFLFVCIARYYEFGPYQDNFLTGKKVLIMESTSS